MPPEISRNVDTNFYFSEHISSTKEGRKDPLFLLRIAELFCNSVDSA